MGLFDLKIHRLSIVIVPLANLVSSYKGTLSPGNVMNKVSTDVIHVLFN